MRNLNLKVASLLILFVATGFLKAQTTSPPLTYMQELSTITSELKDETWQYLKAVTKGKGARKVEKKRMELIKEVSVRKSQVSAKKPFTEDASYKNAVKDYLQMTYTVLKEDFDKILDMEDIAEQSYDLMEAYILAKELANKKLDDAFEKLIAAQEKFAAANDITLVEGEMDKKSAKIDKASKALEYYNDVFLIFFKSYKQEAYIMDAFERADVNAMEQNINSMLLFNEEGVEKLKQLDSYNGDAQLKVAANQVFKYFDEEAKIHYPSMVNFYVAKDNFEKAQKVMETTKKSKRTKEQVETYNKAVAEFNKEVKKFNETSELTNKGRSKTLDYWNKEVDRFFDRNAN
ncbi:hypothetical protein E9993_18240 [Labilibacter sediminis]|nr:hypothetical protein E9993_18240 [Labilibacter sediminis]